MVYPLCSKRYKKKISKRKKENKIYTLIAQKISRVVYYFSWIFAVTSKIVVGMFVSARGFTDYYIHIIFNCIIGKWAEINCDIGNIVCFCIFYL